MFCKHDEQTEQSRGLSTRKTLYGSPNIASIIDSDDGDEKENSSESDAGWYDFHERANNDSNLRRGKLDHRVKQCVLCVCVCLVLAKVGMCV